MPTNPAEEIPTPTSIARYVKSNAARAKKAQQMHHGASEVVREADYKGHHIMVRTKYEVEVDGKPLMGHLGVTDSGSVHYHPVPNMSFGSALDMVKKIIDVFPDDFSTSAPDAAHGRDHATHGMPGTVMKKTSATKKTAKPIVKRKQ
jgi:hypothetical protein